MTLHTTLTPSLPMADNVSIPAAEYAALRMCAATMKHPASSGAWPDLWVEMRDAALEQLEAVS